MSYTGKDSERRCRAINKKVNKMKEETEKIVSVWYGEAMGYDDRMWVVCDEEIYVDGTTESTHTVSIHAEKSEAIKFGRDRANHRGVRFLLQGIRR